MISKRRRERLMHKLRRVAVFDFEDLTSDTPANQFLGELRIALEAMQTWPKYHPDVARAPADTRGAAIDVSMLMEMDDYRRTVVREFVEQEVKLEGSGLGRGMNGPDQGVSWGR